ncbi:hypothetical protein IU414_28815 [Nocardia farcinica]|nr:hypothetical protein [Nocardia farcinica]
MGRVRIGVAALAVAGALLVTGCGADTEDAAAPPPAAPLGTVVPAAPATGEPFTSPDALALRLLADTELPAGMTAAYDPSTDAPGQQAGVPAPTTPPGCGKVLMELGHQRPEALAWTAVAYNGPDFASIDIDAASYRPEAVGPAFTAVQETLRGCTEYFGEDADDARIDYRLGALAQPPAGDAATAFELRMTSEGLTLVAHVALVQVGTTLAQISVTAPESSDPALLAELTAAQVRKLRGVTEP